MLQECLKKVLYGEFQEGNGQKKSYKETKALVKDSNIPTDSLAQAAQDRTKWCCLIKEGAAQYEAKRICEAERKFKECEERAKGSTSRVVTVHVYLLYLQQTVKK